MRRIGIAALALALLGCSGSVPPEPAAAEQRAPATVTTETNPASGGRSAGRVGAPAWLPCDRSDVTSYIGRVTDYDRRSGEIDVTISTDWDTVETVRLVSARPEESFRIDAEPFRAEDWSRLESSPGELHEGMRIQAWICSDGGTVLDWRPQPSE